MNSYKIKIQYFFTISVIIFMLSQCNQYHCYKNKIINKYENNRHQKKYKKYSNQNNYKHFEIFNCNNNCTNNNQMIHSFIHDCLLFEMHINHNSVNLLNTYVKNDKQLIFNQINLKNSHEKTTYNFGIGCRKNYRKHLIIGNNIFYDTILSENKKKILSIGHEILKKQTHITTNIYYKIFNKPHSIIKQKKHYLHSYDIRIKNTLPFFRKTIGKVNIEHSFNHNNKYYFLLLHSTPLVKQHKSHYKITLGMDYIPTSILTFSIDKIIYNSKKNYGTKFNITVNYKLNTLQKNIITPYYQSINNNKTTLINKNNIVNRNNNILTDDYNNRSNITQYIHINYSDRIQVLNTENACHANNITNQTKNIEQEKYTIFKLEKNNDNIQCQQDNYLNYDILNLLAVVTTYNTTKNKHLNYNPSISMTKPFNLTLSQNVYISHNNIDIPLSNNKNKIKQTTNTELSENNIHNNNINIINNHKYPNTPDQNTTQKSLTNDTKEKNMNNDHHHNNNQIQIIPPPPPLPNTDLISKKQTDMLKQQIDQFTTNIYDNYDNQISSQLLIQNLNQCKQKQFSSLGSEQHIAKLNNITKKRKKTTSTNSTNSNSSELATILKIIERQNILTSDSDNTDNDDKISMNSNNNEFSDH